ncbi:Serine acetyltransferase 5 [Acorus gramineus]|uniref:serine O-acetyltransferase n=1 Tax=Acorus gramineus TaxID=55184 RepID=A0AAV9AMJ5_ACOGR|nr:Serine acetyltransferase 5 [Acorus gramineus]
MPSGQSHPASTTTTTNNQHPPSMTTTNNHHHPIFPPPESESETSWVWTQIKAEARRDAESEPALATHLYSTILSHPSLDRSLSFHLANKLSSSTLLSTLLYDLFLLSFSSDPSLVSSAVADLLAVRHRDPACVSFSHCLLNYKGFLACQAQRVAHRLWLQSRLPMALALHSRIADVFAVDIHPAARIGKGVLFDHATGLVVGETAVIGNNVSILHHVTLGGTGKVGGDRHPKIGDGVLIGAGATVLGNVKIGEGAKIGAGSLVLIDVPPRTTAVGNPARLIGGKERPARHEDVPGESMDHTSFISEWSDYII